MLELGQMENLPDILSGFPIWLQYLIALLVFLTFLSELLHRIWQIPRSPMNKLWPSREKWNAICLPWKEGDPNKGAPELNANLPLHYPGQRWCQMRNMETGDYYQVDMQKDRVISRLRLTCYEGRHPLKYCLEIARANSINDFESLGVKDGPIDYRFDKPRKFRVVKFTIVEPDILPDSVWHSWCIYDVQFEEVRLFGRWWKKVVHI